MYKKGVESGSEGQVDICIYDLMTLFTKYLKPAASLDSDP